LLGILEKGTLTPGDSQFDFSRSVIFMTGNLGAAEMSALVKVAVFGAFTCRTQNPESSLK
jgi:ATP-dependent Clp protease ATP-binding subunit ClpA